MGIDCAVIAKLKNGTYKGRHFDRLYVYSQEVNNHEGLENEDVSFDKNDLEKHRKFTIQYGIKWCKQRLLTISLLTPEQAREEFEFNPGEEMQPRINYQINYVKDLLDFLKSIQLDEIEWVGIFHDSGSEIYDDIWIGLSNDAVILMKI